MKLIFLIGNSSVGKMTVGQELMKITDLRLFHNHMTIEPIIEIFGYYNSKIIVFAQEAGESWFKKSNIPWGGVLVSLTWGLAHIFTKGNLLIGILSFLSGLLYGSVYIICKKNIYIAYPIIFLMFAL